MSEDKTTRPVELECERCAFCAERGETVLEAAEGLKLVDVNEKDVQILDLIVHLHHRYDQVPEADRIYATWQSLIESVEIHYNAEVAGEDCDADCDKHAHLFNEDDNDEEEHTT